MAGRVSQVAVEVLRAGTAKGRTSQVAVEVLQVGNPAARLSQTAVEVLRSLTVAVTAGRVSQVVAEVLRAGTAKARASQVAVEVLLADPVLKARVSQVAAEVLLTGAPAARVSQVAAEVLRGVLSLARLTQLCVEVLRTARDEDDPIPPGEGGGSGGSQMAVKRVKRAETVAAWQAKLTAWGATDQVRLFTNDLVLNELTVVADFTNPVGGWYDPTAHLVVYSEPFIDPVTGLLEIGGLDTQYDWAAGGGAVEVDIWGWYVSSTLNADWRFAEKFDAARHLGDALASLPVRPRVQVPIISGQRWP